MVAQITYSPPGPERGGSQTQAQPADWDLSHVSFGDVLSSINPLQYLPVVGTIYREVTGDTVHPAFRMGVAAVGAMLLGGPIGLAATMLGSLFTELAHGHLDLTPDPAQQMAAANTYRHLVRSA